MVTFVMSRNSIEASRFSKDFSLNIKQYIQKLNDVSVSVLDIMYYIHGKYERNRYIHIIRGLR